MNNQEPKLPKQNAVKELRKRLKNLKEDRMKHYDKLIDAWKKKPAKKIASPDKSSDVEI